MTKTMTPAGADRPDYEDAATGWTALPAATRAELLLQGAPFPGETPTEARCRLKRSLQLMDDDDLAALLDRSHDTLARMRVDGKGPLPIRVGRAIFYDQKDVHDWIRRHRDVVSA